MGGWWGRYDRFMTVKHKGGRGKTATNKYERFTATMAPDLLARLDEYAAARSLPRSEALAQLVDRGLKFTRGTRKKDVISVSQET